MTEKDKFEYLDFAKNLAHDACYIKLCASPIMYKCNYWGDGCILAANPETHRVSLDMVSKCIEEL